MGADLVQAHIGGTEGFPSGVSIVAVAFVITEETVAFLQRMLFLKKVFQSHEQ